MAAVVEVEGVSKTFGSGELAVQALKPCSFVVQQGELAALIGPSGSGKSTLLLSISLILEPTAGRIVINGQEVYNNGWTGVDERAFRRRNIGFIFQQHNLIPFLTAQENVALMMQLNGASRRDAARRAREPPLILADEPTAALDTDRGSKVMALLKKIARERRSAVIAVTHDHRMIEGFDTVYRLEDGVLARMPQTAVHG